MCYLKAAGELPPDPAGEELHQLLVVHVQQLVQVHPAVRELAEGPLLLHIHSIRIVSHDVLQVPLVPM